MTTTQWVTTRERAEGGGDCAFNAFVLAFCDPRVFKEVEEIIKRSGNGDPGTEFYSFFEKALKAFPEFAKRDPLTVTWKELREKILSLRSTDPKTLQIILGPVMRELAVELMKNDHEFAGKMTDSLLAAFENQLSNKKVLSDDIFTLPRVQLKFAQLKMEFNKADPNSLNSLREKLRNWWLDEGGKDVFLEDLAHPHEQAGDLELSYLAAYFRVNLKIKKDGVEIPTKQHFGFFTVGDLFHHGILKTGSTLEQYQLLENLESRQLIEHRQENDPTAHFSESSKEEWEKRLNAVPEIAKVLTYLQKVLKGQLGRITTGVAHVKMPPDIQVPDEWSEECKNELRKRGVITLNQFNCLSYSEILNRIKKIDVIFDKDAAKELLEIRNTNYVSQPLVILHHSGGASHAGGYSYAEGHWDNERLVSEPIPASVATPVKSVPPTAPAKETQPAAKTSSPPLQPIATQPAPTTTTTPTPTPTPTVTPVRDIREDLHNAIDMLMKANSMLDEILKKEFPVEYEKIHGKEEVKESKQEEAEETKPEAQNSYFSYLPLPSWATWWRQPASKTTPNDTVTPTPSTNKSEKP